MKVLLAVCLTAAALFGHTYAQSADSLRRFMVENNADVVETAAHFGLSLEHAHGLLGINDFFEEPKLGYLWVQCVKGTVLLHGSAADIGFDLNWLTDHLNLRLRNDLALVRHCGSDDRDATPLHLGIDIWTVGEDYPVAYHVEAHVFIFDSAIALPSHYESPYSTAVLGYGNAKQLVDGKIEDLIDKIVREVALEYVKYTGK